MLIELIGAHLCLSMAIFHEARSESIREQMIVGHVIMNRTEFRKKSVCEVVREPSQFSWVIDGKGRIPNRKNKIEAAAWKQAYTIAHDVLYRNYDPLNGANHFWAHEFKGKDFRPNWANTCEWEKAVGKTTYCLILNRWAENALALRESS